MIKRFLESQVQKAIKAELEKTKGNITRKTITEMTREQLNSVLKGCINIENLPEQEKNEMLASARRIFEEQAFGFVIRSLLEAQKDFIATQSTNENQDLMGRFTINGIVLVNEEMERLRLDFLNKIQNNSFNKNDL